MSLALEIDTAIDANHALVVLRGGIDLRADRRADRRKQLDQLALLQVVAAVESALIRERYL